jgi:hypothetical protein
MLQKKEKMGQIRQVSQLKQARHEEQIGATIYIT